MTRTRGSASGVELDQPAAIRRRTDDDIGNDRLGNAGLEACPRLRIELADFGEHVDEILLVDPADLLEAREVAARQKFEIGDKCLHGGIEAIAQAQLNGEAFAERAGEDAGRIELLQHEKDARHICRARSKPCRRFSDLRMQIARFVELVDEMLGNQPVGGGGKRKCDLLEQRLAQGLPAGDEIVEIISLAVVAAAGARHRFPLAEQFRCIGALRSRVVLEDVGEVGIEFGTEPFAGTCCGAVVEIALVGRLFPAAQFGGQARLLALGPIRTETRLIGRLKFKQRIFLDFLGNELAEFEMRHLKQLDRLHQLRRHDQRL
ncbi:hypothetical protein ABIA15_003400 [Sinorhizobium fredii]